MQKNNKDYQVLARKYRPQTFEDVMGQDPIVTTLKNAIKNNRLAHAYLFCGSRGTGKTTLARLFAKALNCPHRNEQGEPCNQCSSCKEITSGHSLDVLEIDGASHRGIDDVRQINETVGYAAAHGGYKIYIIDEVHMLTKEAFNALLKTLEEPPPRVMFFFATTEPHKVLPTILSRCQRFNLSRIAVDKIVNKLHKMCIELGLTVQKEALQLIANHAEGGFRDAESLLDQMISFHEGEITSDSVASLLGIMPQDSFFALDQAGKEGNLAAAFEIAHQVFSQGKDINHFVECLTEHFRCILMVKIGEKAAPFTHLNELQRTKYEASAKMYTQEQVLNILEDLIPAQNQIRFMPSSRIGLEAILLKILRSHQRIPIEFLVRRLSELEQAAAATASPLSPIPPAQNPAPVIPPASTQKPMPAPIIPAPPPSISLTPEPPSISIDPHPSPGDLGKKNKPLPPSSKNIEEPLSLNPSERPSLKQEKIATSEPPPKLLPKDQNRLDTLLQFAAIELEGTIHRKF